MADEDRVSRDARAEAPPFEDPPDDYSLVKEGEHWLAYHKTLLLGHLDHRDDALAACREHDVWRRYNAAREWLEACAHRLESIVSLESDWRKHCRVSAGQIRRALQELARLFPPVGGLHKSGSTPTVALSDLTDAKRDEIEVLRKQLVAALGERDTPQTADFLRAIACEADHQVARWGTEHDAGKSPEDWFWLIGYLAGKALHASSHGENDKAMHHTISSAAALLNWHRLLAGRPTAMRPGIDPPSDLQKDVLSDHHIADDVAAPTLRDDGSCYVVAYTDAGGVQQEHFHGSLEDACDDFRARTVEAVIRRYVPDDRLVAADPLEVDATPVEPDPEMEKCAACDATWLSGEPLARYHERLARLRSKA